MLHRKLSILKEIFGSYKREGQNQYLFFCPNPNCNHHKPKFSVNLNEGGKCWICDIKSPNLRFFVKQYGTWEQLRAWEQLTGQIDLSNKRRNPLEKPTLNPPKQHLKLPDEFKSLTSEKHNIFASPALKYLKDRGVTRNDILRWKIGYASEGKYKNRIIIPSFDLEGKLNYFIARTYIDDRIKYLNPKVKHDIAFNELFVDWSQDVILVEGVFDAIVAGNAIPLLTSTLREESYLFKTIVKNNPKLFLALDPNARAKENKIAAKFIEYGVNIHKIKIAPYDDVGKMPKTEFRKRKVEAVFLNPITYLRYKIG